MTDDSRASEHAANGRGAARALFRIAAFGSAVLLAGGLVGQALRDRSVATALLMYIPLPLVGAFALFLDLAGKGRALPRLRFGLSILGMAGVAGSVPVLIGSGLVEAARPREREVSVLHWNVQWGGGLFRGPRTWEAQRATIVEKDADLIVLSEAPPGDWIDRLVNDIGPSASYVGVHHDPRSPYWYRMAVCSRWPLRLEGRLVLPGGTGMSVLADVGGRPLRLLVVDGVSSPMRSRLPFLRSIAAACDEARAAGRPFDLVLGDFNTPGRSLGFDGLSALGYRLAGRSAAGWRATFPSWLPVYDIDHVWIGPGPRPGSCTFFNGPHTDHRGQVVRVFLPEEPRE